MESSSRRSVFVYLLIIPLVVGVITVVIGLVIEYGLFVPEKQSQNNKQTSEKIIIRVSGRSSGEVISNCEVILEVPGQAPLHSITDSQGIAVLFLPADVINSPGLLRVKANGYLDYSRNMTLISEQLPAEVQLDRLDQ